MNNIPLEYADAQDDPETWVPIPRERIRVPIAGVRGRERARVSFRRIDEPARRADVRRDRFGLTVLLSRAAAPGEPASARVGAFMCRQVIVVVGDPGQWTLGGYYFWPPTSSEAAGLVTE